MSSEVQMKAILCRGYGSIDQLSLGDYPRPEPKANEVRVRLETTTVTKGDCEFRSASLPPVIQFPMKLYFGYSKPKNPILGSEFAGVIDAVGERVSQFQPGDQVFGFTGMRLGAYAEYLCQPEDYALATIPKNMNFQEAATIPIGGLNALHFIRMARLNPGQHILIHGAGGTIGTYAVQLANYFGAEITTVDLGEKKDMLQSLGAHHHLDYTQEDFTQKRSTYDVVLDISGKTHYSKTLQTLKPRGRYLLANPPGLGPVFRSLWSNLISSKTVLPGLAGEKIEDLVYLRQLIEADQLKAVIDREYSLEEIPEAHRYVESGLKQGHVVVKVG